MELLRFYLKKEIKALHENGIKLNFIGEREKLSPDISEKLLDVEELTKNNSKLVLTIALSYGSRQEIIRAVRLVAKEISDGKLAQNEINEQSFSKFLYTIDI